jgi:hypothetical protein
MKDLLVYVADADALAFLKALLERPQALGIRPITFDIERHPSRDSGMVQSGAELARMKKGRYHKALLMWDHHGSGRDLKHTPEKVQADIQSKLDSFTWKDNSATIVLVPELEQWLWFCTNAVASHCNITVQQLDVWVDAHALKRGMAADILKAQQPKELFEHIMRERLGRTISPRDFEKIGTRASVNGLRHCSSFRNVAETLQAWFPESPEPLP